MRRIIAALQISLDGFVEGRNGELDWITNWDDPFNVVERVDTCILGGGMYPGYEEYWDAVLADPASVLPLTRRPATDGEVAYAQFAGNATHVVLSRTLDRVKWRHTRIVPDLGQIRDLKQQQGKDMYAVGGATLVSSLIDAGLVDELRLIVHPILLGGGKALFKDVNGRHPLKLAGTRTLESGRVELAYAV